MKLLKIFTFSCARIFFLVVVATQLACGNTSTQFLSPGMASSRNIQPIQDNENLSAKLKVGPKVEVDTSNARHSKLQTSSGESLNIAWNSEGYDSCELVGQDNQILSSELQGTFDLRPVKSFTISLRCASDANQAVLSVDVDIINLEIFFIEKPAPISFSNLASFAIGPASDIVGLSFSLNQGSAISVRGSRFDCQVSEGEHSISIVATYEDGTRSNELSYSWKVDATTPEQEPLEEQVSAPTDEQKPLEEQVSAELRLGNEIIASYQNTLTASFQAKFNEELKIEWFTKGLDSCSLSGENEISISDQLQGKVVSVAKKSFVLKLLCKNDQTEVELSIDISVEMPQLPADTTATACILGASRQQLISSGNLYSHAHAPSHLRHASVAIWLSEAVTLDLREIQGNVIPITGYSQDDVVFIVPSGLTSQKLHYYDQNVRHIKVPSTAIFIHDKRNSNWAQGVLDDAGHVKYLFPEGHELFLPAGQRKVLSEVYDLARRTEAHDNIRLARLNHPDYFNAATGTVSFRFALVPHGHGHVTATVNIPSCD